MKKLTFLCVGSATQDVYLSNSPEFKPVLEHGVEDLQFELGSKIHVNKIDFRTGGGAGNAATTFARNDHESIFLGMIGRNDPASLAVLNDFDKEGINTGFISYSEKYSTDYSTLLLASNGERTILTYRGCGDHLRVKDFDTKPIFAKNSVDWMYVTSLAGHFEIYDELFHAARKNGVKIAWNPGNLELADPKRVRALLADVEVLSVNKEEAQKLVDGNTMEEIARNLKNFVPVVLLTDGKNGSMAIDKTSFIEAGLYNSSAERKDATGAGDSFASGFVAKYASGESLKNAVHFASANSANVIQFIGSKPGILTGKEILEPMPIKVKPTNY